jgi:hypothetical protein
MALLIAIKLGGFFAVSHIVQELIMMRVSALSLNLQLFEWFLLWHCLAPGLSISLM